MITTDDYIKFVSNPILPAENKDEDLWFLFKDKMILIKSDKEKIQIPRFNEENLQTNIKLVDYVENLAKEKNITPAQVALGWLLAQKPWIVPIPGSKKISRIEENIGSMDIVFTEEELKKIREDISHIQLVGARYPKEQEILVDR